jgi:hypothetical protein
MFLVFKCVLAERDQKHLQSAQPALTLKTEQLVYLTTVCIKVQDLTKRDALRIHVKACAEKSPRPQKESKKISKPHGTNCFQGRESALAKKERTEYHR